MKSLIVILCLFSSAAFADITCNKPVFPKNFNFNNFVYHAGCAEGNMMQFNEIDDTIVDPKNPTGHGYSITIQIMADHSAYINYQDGFWVGNIGTGYSFWKQFKTTWSVKNNQLVIDKVGIGTPVQCSDIIGTALMFAYDQKLQGLLAGTNRVVYQYNDGYYDPSECR